MLNHTKIWKNLIFVSLFFLQLWNLGCSKPIIQLHVSYPFCDRILQKITNKTKIAISFDRKLRFSRALCRLKAEILLCSTAKEFFKSAFSIKTYGDFNFLQFSEMFKKNQKITKIKHFQNSQNFLKNHKIFLKNHKNLKKVRIFHKNQRNS